MLLSALLQPIWTLVIDKVIFEFVSNLARRADSPWRPGLEIEAVRHFKQSAKQFEGIAGSAKPEVAVSTFLSHC